MDRIKKAKGKNRTSLKSNDRPDRVPVPDEFCQQFVALNGKINDLRQQGQAIVQSAVILLKIPSGYILDLDQKAFVPPAETLKAKE